MRLIILPLSLSLLVLASPIATSTAIGEQDQPTRQRKKQVKRCVDFDQTLSADQESITLALDNQCKFEVQCTMSWRVACDADDEDSPNRTKRESFELGTGAAYSAVADAGPCGDDGWQGAMARMDDHGRASVGTWDVEPLCSKLRPTHERDDAKPCQDS